MAARFPLSGGQPNRCRRPSPRPGLPALARRASTRPPLLTSRLPTRSFALRFSRASRPPQGPAEARAQTEADVAECLAVALRAKAEASQLPVYALRARSTFAGVIGSVR